MPDYNLSLESIFFYFLENKSEITVQSLVMIQPCSYMPSVHVPLLVCSETKANAGCWPISTHNLSLWSQHVPTDYSQGVKTEVLRWHSASCSLTSLNSFIRVEGWVSI